MEEGNETFYCSFVSTHYIVCECGETFSGEDALKAHLEKGHKIAKENVVIVKKKPQKDVGSKLRVYSGSGPLHINGRPVYIINTTKIKEEIKEEIEFGQPDDGALTVLEDHLENHHADEIKQEIIYELPEGVTEEYVVPAAAPEDPDTPGQYDTMVTSTHQLGREHNYDKSVRENEIFCEICGKSFGSERAARFHMYRMHQMTPEERAKRVVRKHAVCEVCGKNFASQAALRYHQRVHTGEKPYPCTECPKRFSMPLFLQIHLRTHTGERPYQCPHCPKAFGNKAALLRHDRVHTGEKPYVCPTCQKAFSQSNSMKLHVRTVHLKLPAPYKSRARRLRGGRRAAGAGAEEPVPVVFTLDGQHYDDTLSMLCETIEAPRAIIP